MSTALKTGDVAAAATRKRSFIRKSSRTSIGEEELEEEDGEEPDIPGQKISIWRRLYGYLLFGWALIESIMVSMTSWLDKFSKDYRHVSKCLTKERREMKVQPSTNMSRSSSSSENIDESRDDLQTVIDLRLDLTSYFFSASVQNLKIYQFLFTGKRTRKRKKRVTFS